jgi:hypothetical protein
MPKEQINHPKIVTSDGHPGYTVTEPTLHVGWNRMGWVQIHIQAEPDYFKDASADSTNADGISVFTEPLSRNEINKLIRTLRKARDQAYGQDA